MDGQRVFAALGRRKQARQRAYVGLLHAWRCFEGCHGFAVERAGHERVPDLTRAGDAEDVLHGRVVRVAHPHAGDQVGGVADDPRVAVLVGRARLDRGWSVRQYQRAVCAVRRLARLVV